MNVGEWISGIVDHLPDDGNEYLDRVNYALANNTGANVVVKTIRKRVSDAIAESLREAENDPCGYPYKVARAHHLRTTKTIAPSRKQVVEILRHTVEVIKDLAEEASTTNCYCPRSDSDDIVPTDSRKKGQRRAIPVALLVFSTLSYIEGIRDGRNTVLGALTHGTVDENILFLVHRAVEKTSDFVRDYILKGTLREQLQIARKWTEPTIAPDVIDRVANKYGYQFRTRLTFSWMSLLSRRGANLNLLPPEEAIEVAPWIRWFMRHNDISLPNADHDKHDIDLVEGGQEGTVVTKKIKYFGQSFIATYIGLYLQMFKNAFNTDKNNAFPLEQMLILNCMLMRVTNNKDRGKMFAAEWDLTEFSSELSGYIARWMMPNEWFDRLMGEGSNEASIMNVPLLYFRCLFEEKEGELFRCSVRILFFCVRNSTYRPTPCVPLLYITSTGSGSD